MTINYLEYLFQIMIIYKHKKSNLDNKLNIKLLIWFLNLNFNYLNN